MSAESHRKRSGAEGNRTLYLLHAMQALSQMSYGPGPTLEDCAR